MSASFDLLVVGRPSVDVMFAGLPEWPALGKDVECDGLGVCAGTTFNTPAAANRIGLRVAYVATVGDDLWSRIIREEFDAEGLPTDFLEIEDRPLPGVSVALNHAGDRGFVTHWGSDDTYGAKLDARALEVLTRVDARHLHTYVGESPELLAAARRRGMTISLDAWDGPSWSSSRPIAELLAQADVLLANESEATAMTGETELQGAMDRLAEHCGCVVIKRGASGAIGLEGGRMRAVSADPVAVVDSTGAGDAFNAGFLAGWLGRLALEDSLILGVICGSRAAGDYGGYRGCPREPELRAIAASRGITLPSREPVPKGDPA
ncbi:MAG TPA: carbohydrate kinase family protein [Actinomycetota bacterium]|jgi:sugar/nucleoside kinase (ribokinase family)|nr:carbohydrate kinase family protein [Actinomycetota bacterium]